MHAHLCLIQQIDLIASFNEKNPNLISGFCKEFLQNLF